MEGTNHAHLFVFSGNNKAGMQDIDKERQARVIYESSRNSAYFKRAEEQDKKTEEKIKIMKKKLEQVTPTQSASNKTAVNKRILELELKRNLDRICCVIDMDMFYAAVEIRDNPSLANVPLAVGGKSMISTTNYIARKYGVRSAMPGFIGLKLCPQLVFVKPNFDKYTHIGHQIRQIISEYDPHYVSHSLDEVYFDLTDYVLKQMNISVVKSDDMKYNNNNDIHYDENMDDDEDEDEGRRIVSSATIQSPIKFSSNPQIGHYNTSSSSSSSSSSHNRVHLNDSSNQDQATTTIEAISSKFPYNPPISTIYPSILEQRKIASRILTEIRQRITTETNGLTCSAGMANNFRLAKICADINKPNGQYELSPFRDDILNFVASLSPRKVGGIGKVTEKILSSMQMTSMNDVRNRLFEIYYLFTPAIADFLIQASLGISDSEGETARRPPDPRKSIGTERTFSAISEVHALIEKLSSICHLVADDLKSHQLSGQTVTLKLKTVKFELYTRSMTVTKYISEYQDIYDIAYKLLMNMVPISIRLMGIQISKLKLPTTTITNTNSSNKSAIEKYTIPITCIPTSPSPTPSPTHVNPSDIDVDTRNEDDKKNNNEDNNKDNNKGDNKDYDDNNKGDNDDINDINDIKHHMNHITHIQSTSLPPMNNSSTTSSSNKDNISSNSSSGNKDNSSSSSSRSSSSNNLKKYFMKENISPMKNLTTTTILRDSNTHRDDNSSGSSSHGECKNVISSNYKNSSSSSSNPDNSDYQQIDIPNTNDCNKMKSSSGSSSSTKMFYHSNIHESTTTSSSYICPICTISICGTQYTYQLHVNTCLETKNTKKLLAGPIIEKRDNHTINRYFNTYNVDICSEDSTNKPNSIQETLKRKLYQNFSTSNTLSKHPKSLTQPLISNNNDYIIDLCDDEDCIRPPSAGMYIDKNVILIDDFDDNSNR